MTVVFPEGSLGLTLRDEKREGGTFHVCVTKVDSKSPAASCGVEKGFYLLKIGNVETAAYTSVEDLLKALRCSARPLPITFGKCRTWPWNKLDTSMRQVNTTD